MFLHLHGVEAPVVARGLFSVVLVNSFAVYFTHMERRQRFGSKTEFCIPWPRGPAIER